MRTVHHFLVKTSLWILLLPYAATAIGASSNQMVLIANGDRFPVMANPVKSAHWEPDSDGMLDTVHCVMTSKTHLNALADIFDIGSSMWSIGDGFLALGEWLSGFCSFVWVALVIRRLHYD